MYAFASYFSLSSLSFSFSSVAILLMASLYRLLRSWVENYLQDGAYSSTWCCGCCSLDLALLEPVLQSVNFLLAVENGDDAKVSLGESSWILSS